MQVIYLDYFKYPSLINHFIFYCVKYSYLFITKYLPLHFFSNGNELSEYT